MMSRMLKSVLEEVENDREFSKNQNNQTIDVTYHICLLFRFK